MRSVKMTIGLMAAALALGLLAGPASAKTKEKLFFGEFHAGITGKTLSEAEPGSTKGHGTVTGMKLGPYAIECTKELRSKSLITSEKSPNFFTKVKFLGCQTIKKVGGGLEEVVSTRFTKELDLEFRANGSAEGGNTESEIRLVKPVAAVLKAKGASCVVDIPAQSIPNASGINPEKQYEAAGYATETETVEGKKRLKEFPLGFREKLNITMEFKKIHTLVPLNERCTYSKGEEGGFVEIENVPYVEFNKGFLEAELEEIELKGGDLGFTP
jgi:hypothetical protein